MPIKPTGEAPFLAAHAARQHDGITRRQLIRDAILTALGGATGAGLSGCGGGSAAGQDDFVVDDRGPLFYTGVVFGWDQDPGLDSARFVAWAEVAPGKIWLTYSPRHFSSTTGEQGMRLDIAELTYDDSAKKIVVTGRHTIATPTGFTASAGAFWSCGFFVIKTGPNAGRKVAIVNVLNSPDNTYFHPDHRRDIDFWYTDGQTIEGPWTRLPILAGENAHLTFGLPDANVASAGMHVPPGNCVVQLPSGRRVIAGYLYGGPTPHICALYSDAEDGISGWTPSAPLPYVNAGDNEPSICLAADGGLLAFVRNENVASRSIYRSADGTAFTYVRRAAADLPIRNVASSAASTADGVVVVAGATDPYNNRMAHKFFVSRNDAVDFDAGRPLFEPMQSIGYGFLGEMQSGILGLAFEVRSGWGSFNSRSSIGFARFDRAALAGITGPQPLHDELRFNAADEYSKFIAWATADGAVIQDGPAILAAITAAIAGNYYSSIRVAASARWAHKDMGAAGVKLYSLNRTTSTGAILTGGAITLDTATYPYAVPNIPVGSELLFAGAPLHMGDRFAVVLIDKRSDTGPDAGVGFRWTAHGIDHYVHAGGIAHFGKRVATPGSPSAYTPTAGDAAHFFFDMRERVGYAGENGAGGSLTPPPVMAQALYYFPKQTDNGELVTLRLMAIAGATSRHPAEVWFLNGVGVTPEMARQCSADAKARS